MAALMAGNVVESVMTGMPLNDSCSLYEFHRNDRGRLSNFSKLIRPFVLALRCHMSPSPEISTQGSFLKSHPI
jgi:hypothetical protein